MRTLLSIILLCSAFEAAAGAGPLKQQAEAFSGQPVSLDSRLSVPDCPDGLTFAWRSDARSSLIARCNATGWGLVIPVAAGKALASARAPIIVRRGEPLQVIAGGKGFRVLVDGIAERDGRAGERIVVRNQRSGRRMTVDIDADGAIMLSANAAAFVESP